MVTFSYFLMTLLMFAGLFLIGLILLQRGRGGGLAGAFGGMGGQSAFGTKAGDVFTRITIGVAAAWILLCAGSVVALHNSSGGRITALADPAVVKAEGTTKAERAKVDPKGADSNNDDLKLEPNFDDVPATVKAAPLDANKPEVKAEEPKPVDGETKAVPVPPSPTDAKPKDAGEKKRPESKPETSSDDKPN